jgi:hypothetical protein
VAQGIGLEFEPKHHGNKNVLMIGVFSIKNKHRFLNTDF